MNKAKYTKILIKRLQQKEISSPRRRWDYDEDDMSWLNDDEDTVYTDQIRECLGDTFLAGAFDNYNFMSEDECIGIYEFSECITEKFKQYDIYLDDLDITDFASHRREDGEDGWAYAYNNLKKEFPQTVAENWTYSDHMKEYVERNPSPKDNGREEIKQYVYRLTNAFVDDIMSSIFKITVPDSFKSKITLEKVSKYVDQVLSRKSNESVKDWDWMDWSEIAVGVLDEVGIIDWAADTILDKVWNEEC